MKEKFNFEEFFKVKEVDGEKCLVAVKPMTREQARQAYPYRPYSKYAESRFGGNESFDDNFLIISEYGARCKMCQAPTKKEHLIDEICYDCNGYAEFNGMNPHKKV